METTNDAWPPLSLNEWKDTYATLHMWTQIVGKTRLKLAPWQNHWWHVPLYLTARGLSTGPMPYASRTLDVEFDFVEHQLVLRTGEGSMQTIRLEPQSVASFYARYRAALQELKLNIKLWPIPVEVEHTIRFTEDQQHSSYSPEHANRLWRILVQVERVFKTFRAGYVGKSSPVHFFWGSFDLAVTRFSGQTAPQRPGADAVTREAYSHAVISAGFWPGSGPIQEPAFYAYAVPEPEGLGNTAIRPEAAYYHSELSEFILLYEAVRSSVSPDEAILDFLQTTYSAAADLGGWDRTALEGRPRSRS